MDKIIQEHVRRWRAEPTAEHAQSVAHAVSRTLPGGQGPRKVVISPGYGGGFAHDIGWRSAKLGRFCAEYPALVAAVEANDDDAIGTALESLVSDVREQFGPEEAENVYGTARTYDYSNTPETPVRAEWGSLEGREVWRTDFAVREVTGPYRITEYDGAEGIESLLDGLDKYW